MVAMAYKLTDELAQEICTRISKGENITDICKDKHMPDIANFWTWKRRDPILAENVRLAMQDKAETIVDSMDEIEGLVRAGELDSGGANVIMANRRWKASKYYPRMYGDKQIVESKNENLNQNLNIEMPITDADTEILKRFGFNVDKDV